MKYSHQQSLSEFKSLSRHTNNVCSYWDKSLCFPGVEETDWAKKNYQKAPPRGLN